VDKEAERWSILQSQLRLSPGRVGSQWGSIMRVKNNFAAQEGMCLERAAVAKREMEYWLSEAAEWKKLRESSDPLRDCIAVQLDWCAASNSL
jgi:hypothetical protein